jgi:hypothetical protein
MAEILFPVADQQSDQADNPRSATVPEIRDMSRVSIEIEDADNTRQTR